MEQGSYLLIEPGMTVDGTDGSIGTVSEVVADENADIFRGIIVIHGFLVHKKLFVPADQIVSVTGDIVNLSLTKDEADALPPAPVSSNS